MDAQVAASDKKEQKIRKAINNELEDITGFVMPDDVGDEKPDDPPKAWDIDLPERWDWREQGVGLPEARQQGSCGRCWAFSAIFTLEAAIAAFDQQIVNLSEQQVLDCSGVGSCSGGGWAYGIFKSNGIVFEADYPYKAYDQYCKQAGKPVQYKIESWHHAQKNIEAMKAAIFQHGSVGVRMSACGSVGGYSGGVYDSYECNNKGINHKVALAGWDDTIEHSKGKGAWLLRNSWGTGWGEEGYGWFAYGTARLQEYPTYIVYQPIDPTDTDEDGILDVHDNCKNEPNEDQADADHDGEGDACDPQFDAFEKTLSLSDDDSRKLELGFAFPFFGTGYLQVHVNSDGNITFVEADDSTGKRDKTHLLSGAPRIAPVFADLNPGKGGKIKWGKADPDSMFVKWDAVPRFDKKGSATAKVTLQSSGDIVFEWDDVTGPTYVVGISAGGEDNLAGEVNLEGGLISFQGTTAMYEDFNSSKPFDLAGKTLTLTPTDGPQPPPAEVMLPLGDDDSKEVTLGFDFPFFGQSYPSVHVNSDGNLTFGTSDSKAAKRDTKRFLTGAPRIATLFADLDPSSGGAVSYLQADGSVTISYKSVKLYGKSQTASVSVTLYASGQINISYGQVGGSSYITGISKGGTDNTGVGEQPLSQLVLPIGYGGSNTIFQRFGDPEPFDLFNKTISFLPDGGVDPPPPPPQEIYLSLGDDDSEAIPIGFDFPFFGTTYQTIHANSDGNLTFGSGDSATAERDEARFLNNSRPRIGLLYADLDPSDSGAISYRHDDAETLTISYTALPVYGGGGSNTARVSLKPDGAITMTFEGLTMSSAIIGVSQGGQDNSGTAVAIDQLLGGYHNYGGGGASYAIYDSSDPFNLTGTTVTLAP